MKQKRPCSAARCCTYHESKRAASLLRNSRAAATKFGIRSAPYGRVAVCLILLRARMQLHETKNKFFAPRHMISPLRTASCFALSLCYKNSQLAPLTLFVWLYCSFLLASLVNGRGLARGAPSSFTETGRYHKKTEAHSRVPPPKTAFSGNPFIFADPRRL